MASWRVSAPIIQLLEDSEKRVTERTDWAQHGELAGRAGEMAKIPRSG